MTCQSDTSIKTRIKTFLISSLDINSNVRQSDTSIKTRIKTGELFPQSLPVAICQSDTSIKTRIKTSWSFPPIFTFFVSVRVILPLKQGLRPNSVYFHSRFSMDRVILPLKQGLRPRSSLIRMKLPHYCQSATSIKTRIKTWFFSQSRSKRLIMQD